MFVITDNSSNGPGVAQSTINLVAIRLLMEFTISAHPYPSKSAYGGSESKSTQKLITIFWCFKFYKSYLGVPIHSEHPVELNQIAITLNRTQMKHSLCITPANSPDKCFRFQFFVSLHFVWRVHAYEKHFVVSFKYIKIQLCYNFIMAVDLAIYLPCHGFSEMDILHNWNGGV